MYRESAQPLPKGEKKLILKWISGSYWKFLKDVA